MPDRRLPGFTYTVRDGGLVPAALIPSTENLLIIGNALDGPVNSPRRISTMQDAENIFGPIVYRSEYLNPANGTADGTYADNNLLKALYEALQGGAGNVTLCRVGGTSAQAVATLSASVTFSAMNPGRIYNGVTIVSASGASGYTITVNQPRVKGGSVSWDFTPTKTLRDLVTTINNDSRNQTILLSIPVASANNLITTLGVGTVNLSGTSAGTNGTAAVGEDYASSKAGYYTKLTQEGGTFDTIVDIDTDVIFLSGVYADEQVVDSGGTTTTTAAQALAEFAYKVSKETKPCHAVIGLRPTLLNSPADLKTYAETALLSTSAGFYNTAARWIKFGYFMNAGFYYADSEVGENVDIGRHLSVIAGPDVVFSQKDIGMYTENGAAAYAGLITSLPPQSATTNKPLGTVKIIYGRFTKNIHEKLNQGIGRNLNTNTFGSAAYVTFKTDAEASNRPVVVEDNTCAQRTSDYRTLQAHRIVNLACSLAKTILRPFIGEPNNIEAKNAMRTQLGSALDKMVAIGALAGGDGNGYKFYIDQDPIELVSGQISVTLLLRLALQIKFIKVNVSVTG